LESGSKLAALLTLHVIVALLWAAGARPAFSQTNILYAWTNFVGQPSFEESTDGPDSLANTGSADGSGSAARFYHPNGVAVDDAGNLFVADTGNHTIRKLTPDGLVTTLAGGPGAKGTNGDTGGAAPVFGPDGEPLDGPGASGTNDGVGRAARFFRPESVTVDRAGNVFVADTMNNTIRKVTSAGVVTTLAGNGNVWPPRSVDGPGRIPWSHKLPGAAEYRTGREFLAHAADDGIGSAARFFSPAGVAVDRADNVFVADGANNRIRKVTAMGVVTMLAGGPRSLGSADGTGSAARFNFPHGVAVDRAGNLFVADCGNATVRKVTPAGVVTTIGGAPGVTGWADGIGTSAQFCSPCGIAVDRAGRLYVVDAGNNRIAKGTPVGR
jgi:sugar lactone lactonase YvrE